MSIRAEEITAILKSQIKEYDKRIDVAETGMVLTVGDGIARVYGLEKAMAGELLEFPHDVAGWCSTSRRTTSAWRCWATTS